MKIFRIIVFPQKKYFARIQYFLNWLRYYCRMEEAEKHPVDDDM